ncbi:MAG TPA: hypothetical protein VF316_25670, partial [Polyangiaceae bacterium]
IWALGAILFELLTGQVPFPADTVTQLTAMVVADAPQSIRKLREDVPEELRNIVLKCLEKKRDDRFGSVGELVMALTPFATLQGASAAQSILGSQSAPVVSATSIPAERSSLRTGGGSTSVAWDKTQLAEGVAPRRSKAPLVIAAVVGVGALAVTAFFVLHRTTTPVHAGGTPSATVTAGLPPTSATQAPIASIPDRPLPPPSASVSAAATTARPAPTGRIPVAGAAGTPRDAGAVVSPPPPNPTVTPTPTGHDELPSTRN